MHSPHTHFQRNQSTDVRTLKLSSAHGGVLNHPSFYILLKHKKLVKTNNFANRILNFEQKAIW